MTERKAELERWREREAAVCPEDVPFDEYIGALLKRLAQQEAQIARLREEIQHENRSTQLAATVREALLDWSDGPPTMKSTADWANKWAPYFSAAMREYARAALSAPTGETGGGT